MLTRTDAHRGLGQDHGTGAGARTPRGDRRVGLMHRRRRRPAPDSRGGCAQRRLTGQRGCDRRDAGGVGGAIGVEDATDLALDRFLTSSVAMRRSTKLPGAAWRIADELGWAKTYDAEYVALARLLGCPLVTIDARLKRGASRAVEILGPTEL